MGVIAVRSGLAMGKREEFFNRFGRRKAVWAYNLTSSWLAAKTEGFSGADILEIIGIAKRFAYVRNSWQGESLLLTQEFFLEAITLVKEEHKAKMVVQKQFKNEIHGNSNFSRRSSLKTQKVLGEDSYTKALKKL